ncbi:MAG: multicopper oxidase domain-containing protein [Actinobacteria bacterium]|nr:multicopper oxidase domain-containing protein [Actinomycetota bacterium]
MSNIEKSLRLWRMVALAAIVIAAVALAVSVTVALGDGEDGADDSVATEQYPPEKFLMKGAAHAEAAHKPNPNAKVESYVRPDPTLPAPPPGKIKRFTIDTAERITRVSDEKPGLRVWSFGVNGKHLTGTGGSPPIVVDQGDAVEITLKNGSGESMQVHFPHSFDTHAAEVSPQAAYKSIEPGEQLRFSFKANHPGVFMYHCGTKPVLRHVGAGMAGTMIVRPRGLPKVDRELWFTQQEFYLDKPNGDASVDKMVAKKPDVIAFNGFASQYLKRPIDVRRGERIRIWVLNAGPSLPTYFHVIGSVFDRVWSEGDARRQAQTISLGPSEGGYVELTLNREGTYPFVTHAFGDMVRGAIGALRTPNAPTESQTPPATKMPGGGMGGGDHMDEHGDMDGMDGMEDMDHGDRPMDKQDKEMDTAR